MENKIYKLNILVPNVINLVTTYLQLFDNTYSILT
jgi:hypothetical protein